MSSLGPTPIRSAVLELLAGGPSSLDEIVARLDDRGLLDELRDEGVADSDLGQAVLDEVFVSDEVWAAGAGDRILVLAAHLIDGLVLTHRLTADERETGVVAALPDLVILDWDARDGLDLDAEPGARLERRGGPVVPGEDLSTFAGPDGWLAGFDTGDLLAFTRGGASVTVRRIEDGEWAPEAVAVGQLRHAAERWLSIDEGEEAVPIVLDAIAADVAAGDHNWRRPMRPLGELLEAAGLERRGFSWGWTGTAWQTSSERFRAGLVDRTSDRWGLKPCCSSALAEVRDVLQSFDEDTPPAPEVARVVAGHLSHDMVAGALVDLEAMGTFEQDLPRLAALASWVIERQPRRAAGAHQVLGLLAQRRRDPDAAERAFAAALRVDPGYRAAVVEASCHELDRGHLDRAIALLDQAEVERSDPWFSRIVGLRDLAAEPYRDVGRNDPCPCGSGRRFKTCCQREPKVAVDVALALLRLKLERFVRRDVPRSDLADLALATVEPGTGDLLEQLNSVVFEPFFLDVAAFDGGFGEQYRRERGHRLPPVEAELLDTMLAAPRRLWQVIGDDHDRLRLRADVALAPAAEADDDDGGRKGVGGGDVVADGAEVAIPMPVALDPGLADWILSRVIAVGGGEWRGAGQMLVIPDERVDVLRELLTGPDRGPEVVLAWWAAALIVVD